MYDKEYYKKYYEKNRKRILSSKKAKIWTDKLRHAKKRAKKYNVPFDITPEFLDSIKVDICPILDIELSYSNTRIMDNSATLDRIIPSLGYVPGNVQIMSHLANRMKSSASTDDLVKFASYIIRTTAPSPLTPFPPEER